MIPLERLFEVLQRDHPERREALQALYDYLRAIAKELWGDKQLSEPDWLQDAIQKAARSRYGSETDVRAEINPRTGEIRLQRLLQVVEHVENYATEVDLVEAQNRNPAARVGDFISEPLPPTLGMPDDHPGSR